MGNNSKLSKSEQKVLNVLKKNEFLTVLNLTDILDIKQTAINKAIKGLKQKGIIRRKGSNKTGCWEILI